MKNCTFGVCAIGKKVLCVIQGNLEGGIFTEPFTLRRPRISEVNYENET
jgi:hypothetical protein